MPGVGRGKAKAKGIIRVGPRSATVTGAPMGATVLDPGQTDGSAVPRLRKRPAADIPETLVTKLVGGSPAGDNEESG